MLFKNKKAAMGLSPFVKSIVMVIMCILCIVSFGFYFILQTNPTSDIFASKYGMNDTMTSMQGNINSFKDTANDVQVRLEKAKVQPLEYVFLIFLGAFEIPLRFLFFAGAGILGIINAFLAIIVGGVGEVAGFTPQIGIFMYVVTGLISSALIVTLVLLIIRSIRTGDSG